MERNLTTWSSHLEISLLRVHPVDTPPTITKHLCARLLIVVLRQNTGNNLNTHIKECGWKNYHTCKWSTIQPKKKNEQGLYELTGHRVISRTYLRLKKSKVWKSNLEYVTICIGKKGEEIKKETYLFICVKRNTERLNQKLMRLVTTGGSWEWGARMGVDWIGQDDVSLKISSWIVLIFRTMLMFHTLCKCTQIWNKEGWGRRN